MNRGSDRESGYDRGDEGRRFDNEDEYSNTRRNREEEYTQTGW